MTLKEVFIKTTPYVAVAIFVMLGVLAMLLYQENQITKEISKECGWEDERWRCMCEKNDVIEIENIQNGNFSGLDNVTLVW